MKIQIRKKPTNPIFIGLDENDQYKPSSVLSSEEISQIRKLIDKISFISGIPSKEIISPSRKARSGTLAAARKAVIYILRTETSFSLKEIGTVLKGEGDIEFRSSGVIYGLNHSTIITATKTVTEALSDYEAQRIILDERLRMTVEIILIYRRKNDGERLQEAELEEILREVKEAPRPKKSAYSPKESKPSSPAYFVWSRYSYNSWNVTRKTFTQLECIIEVFAAEVKISGEDLVSSEGAKTFEDYQQMFISLVKKYVRELHEKQYPKLFFSKENPGNFYTKSVIDKLLAQNDSVWNTFPGSIEHPDQRERNIKYRNIFMRIEKEIRNRFTRPVY